LQRQLPARVQREGPAVEHLVILPADEVDVDGRQAGFDHARHHDILPDLLLVAEIW
jgi:hypothetical protein